MNGWAPLAIVLAISGSVSCAGATPQPADLDTRHEACQTCRMIISDASRASQIVAPYEEPRFFDDLSCLSSYVAAHPPASDAVVYVADHRTRAWVRADQAVYTRAAGLDGAMGSNVIAHASIASRDADHDAIGGSPVNPRDVLPATALRGRQPGSGQ